MNARWSDSAKWPSTDSGSFDVLAEGKFSGIGNRVYYRFLAASVGGSACEFRVHVNANSTDVYSATHVIGVGGFDAFDSDFDIAASAGARGDEVTIYLEARRTNGVGTAAAVAVNMNCHTP